MIRRHRSILKSSETSEFGSKDAAVSLTPETITYYYLILDAKISLLSA